MNAPCSDPGTTKSCTVSFLPLISLSLWRVMQQQLSIFSNHSPSLAEQHYTLCYHNLISEPDGDVNAPFLWLSLIYKNRNAQYKDEIFPFDCSLFYFPSIFPEPFICKVLYLLVLCYIFAFSHLFCSYFSPYLSSFSRLQYLIKTKLKLLTSLSSVVSQGLWRTWQCNHIPINFQKPRLTFRNVEYLK